MVILGGGYTLLAYQSGLLDKIIAGEISSIAYRATFTSALLIAYIPLAQYYLIKWSDEHWQQLSRLINNPPALTHKVSLTWGLLGMLVQFFLFFSVVWFRGDVFNLGFWSWLNLFSHLVVIGLGWFLYRLLALLVKYAIQFRQIALSIHSLNLFNLNLPRIFAKQGARSALLIIGFISICGNLIIAPGTRVGVSLTIAIVSGLFALAAFMMPALGIQQRTHQEKRLKTERLLDSIGKLANRAELSDSEYTRLSALLALEARIQNIREWPFDASNISRFILYIGIGLASWVGAALVEKILDIFI